MSATSTVSEKQLEALPLRTNELSEALSLSPSVIRTQEGKLNFNGQTESQGMLLVDSAENVPGSFNPFKSLTRRIVPNSEDFPAD